jgi:hypothetical protein
MGLASIGLASACGTPDSSATWNTVYMTKALDALRADGIPVSDEDLAHLAPTLRAHINPYGKYSFDVESGLARSGFRALREPSAAVSA